MAIGVWTREVYLRPDGEWSPPGPWKGDLAAPDAYSVRDAGGILMWAGLSHRDYVRAMGALYGMRATMLSLVAALPEMGAIAPTLYVEAEALLRWASNNKRVKHFEGGANGVDPGGLLVVLDKEHLRYGAH